MNRPTPTPEETELQEKKQLLEQKQTVLAEHELSLSTLQAKLRSFELEYYLKVGVKYVELDQLQATLDRLLAAKAPFDINATKRATESTKRAEETSRAAEEFEQRERPPEKFQPTPELRALYRELAKLLHPDLTLDPEEKERRHRLMQQVNEAYQAGNLSALQRILDDERNNPAHIKGDDVGSELVRTIRKIAQIDHRIQDVQTEIQELQKTDLYILYQTVEAEAKKGNYLLDKLSSELDSRITFLQEQMSRTQDD
jgi:hypothetical protein